MQYGELDMQLARMHVQERLDGAAAARRAAQAVRRERRPLVMLAGRTLVRVGRRLETLGETGTWERARVM